MPPFHRLLGVRCPPLRPLGERWSSARLSSIAQVFRVECFQRSRDRKEFCLQPRRRLIGAKPTAPGSWAGELRVVHLARDAQGWLEAEHATELVAEGQPIH